MVLSSLDKRLKTQSKLDALTIGLAKPFFVVGCIVSGYAGHFWQVQSPFLQYHLVQGFMETLKSGLCFPGFSFILGCDSCVCINCSSWCQWWSEESCGRITFLVSAYRIGISLYIKLFSFQTCRTQIPLQTVVNALRTICPGCGFKVIIL